MNRNEAVRAASKFARKVYEGDVIACAEILNAESEFIEGDDSSLDDIRFYLHDIQTYCTKLLNAML